MVATRTHVHWLSWDGAMKKSMGVRDIYDNPLVHICQIVPIECRCGPSTVSVDLFLFSDGSVHMAFAGSPDGKQSATVRTLRAQDVAGKFTALDYSSVSQTIAVGTTSGEVLVYGIRAGSLDLVTKIPFDHGKAAHVSAVSWTPDGAAVACGYSTGHIVVRTVLGYELNATHLSNQPVQPQQGDSAVPAPSMLVWGQGATRLFAFSDCLAGQDRTLVSQQVDSLPFVRAALSTMPGEGNSKHICLYSDDKVFMHHCEFEAQELGVQQQGLLWY
ncbi:WD40 repeat protein, partial [Linderina pennispora]